jgi:ATP-binding cassette subfamily F protein uup
VPLIRLDDVSIAFGANALLDQIYFQLDPGEKVGLLGRNGEGKSTLMKIMAGYIPADSGEVWREPTLKLAWLAQEPQLTATDTIYDAVAAGLGELGQWIADYHHLSLNLHQDDKALTRLGELQHKLEAHNGWHFQQRVETTLSRLGLPGEQAVSSLSGGWKRRVALAQALVIEPDVLLLDEPTNHLDFESIRWLEEQILVFQGAVLFVTHDRAFLQRLATRIVDLDRGKLVSWPGNYQDYLRRKAAALEDESRQNAEFDKKLAKEEVWIRQGIKARRTRNEGRVRALKKLRAERAERRNTVGTTQLKLASAEKSGKKVIEAIDVSFAYADKKVVSHFSTLIQRGDKIGLLGPNGAGKSTLIKLLLQQLQPQSGQVELGTRIELAYFDQLREQLDPEMAVADCIADGNDFVEIDGSKRHVISYLADFLFSSVRARSPVKSLSGGERNRLLLARLFTRPANLIVMDEPTNDLDLETLEILEEKLVNYEGTLLLVSHDRAFLDNVVTSVLVFEGEGVINEYIGGYEEWQTLCDERQKQQQAQTVALKEPVKKPKPKSDAKNKLSFKERNELASLPGLIEALETEQAQLTEQINQPDFYKQAQGDVQKALDRLQEIERLLEQAYERWETLDAIEN